MTRRLFLLQSFNDQVTNKLQKLSIFQLNKYLVPPAASEPLHTDCDRPYACFKLRPASSTLFASIGYHQLSEGRYIPTLGLNAQRPLLGATHVGNSKDSCACSIGSLKDCSSQASSPGVSEYSNLLSHLRKDHLPLFFIFKGPPHCPPLPITSS